MVDGEIGKRGGMKKINLKRTVAGELEDIVSRLSEALKSQGFGVLNRIDLHAKIREKTGKEIPATVILGACNPNLAYEAFVANTDVASLLPCNAVVRDLGAGQFSVELARPTALMEILEEEKLVQLAKDADKKLEQALESLA